MHPPLYVQIITPFTAACFHTQPVLLRYPHSRKSHASGMPMSYHTGTSMPGRWRMPSALSRLVVSAFYLVMRKFVSNPNIDRLAPQHPLCRWKSQHCMDCRSGVSVVEPFECVVIDTEPPIHRTIPQLVHRLRDVAHTAPPAPRVQISRVVCCDIFRLPQHFLTGACFVTVLGNYIPLIIKPPRIPPAYPLAIHIARFRSASIVPSH